MTDLSAPAGDGGAAAPAEGALMTLAEMEAAAAAEETAGSGAEERQTGVGEGAEGAPAEPEQAGAEGDGKDKAKSLAPLPPEEIERRWRATSRDLKTTKEEVRALRAQVAQGGQQTGAASPTLQEFQALGNPPDANEDPIAAIEWSNKFNALMQRQLTAQHADSQQAQQQKQAQQAREEFVGFVQQSEDTVRAKYPDFDAAVDFLKNARRDDLIEMGVDEDQADERVQREFLEATIDAFQQGLSPAAIAYKLAKERGYTPAQAKAAAEEVVGATSFEKMAGAVSGAADPLKAIEAGAAAARTLSTAGGGKGTADGGTLEAQIGNLSGAALRDTWKAAKERMNR